MWWQLFIFLGKANKMHSFVNIITLKYDRMLSVSSKLQVGFREPITVKQCIKFLVKLYDFKQTLVCTPKSWLTLDVRYKVLMARYMLSVTKIGRYRRQREGQSQTMPMHSSAKPQSPPFSALSLCACINIDHKQKVCFILYQLGQIVTWKS